MNNNNNYDDDDDDEEEPTNQYNQQQEEEEENHIDENSNDQHQEEEEEGNRSTDAVDPTNPFDEDSVEAAQNLTQQDVFGEDLSDSDDQENNEERPNDTEENEENVPIEEEEEEEQILVDTAKVSTNLGREIHLIKLPSFMKIEPKPFDPEYLHENIDEDDEEGKAQLKLRVENSIRWRYSTTDDGERTRESNTRLIRWSDGSFSLHVGKEIFDVSRANIQGDHNHLFIRHQKSMQAQTVFKTKLSFRQHSNDSLAHLKYKFASKANPAPKVRVLPNIKETFSNSIEAKRREEQRIKAEERRRNQQRRQRERDAFREKNLSSNYLEDRDEQNDEDDDQPSLNKIKRDAKKQKLQRGYSTDNDAADDDEEGRGDDDDDDDNEKFLRQKSSTKHRKVTSSDEEEEQSDQEKSKKKKRLQVSTSQQNDDESNHSD